LPHPRGAVSAVAVAVAVVVAVTMAAVATAAVEAAVEAAEVGSPPPIITLGRERGLNPTRAK
jgi:hypothetical protein